MSNSQQPSSLDHSSHTAPTFDNATPEQSPANFPAPAATGRGSRSGLGLTSLILGIIAFIGAFIPFINYGSGLVALVGLILGVVVLFQKNRSKKSAIAGVITSTIALILSIVLAVVYTAAFIYSVDDAVRNKPAAVAQAPDEPDAGGLEAAGTENDKEVSDTPAVGTRENPAPIGTTIAFSNAGVPTWEITPGAPTLEANSVIAEENQFNDAPPAGSQYVILPLALTYIGAESGTPWLDIDVAFVTAAGTTHEQSDTMVVEPSPLSDINEMYTGAEATGNVAIAVPSKDIEKGTWVISSGFVSDKYFYAAQ